jgi:hypothetical protein
MSRWKSRNGGNGRGNHKPLCSVHRGKIKGKVHYWHRQPMCLNCYRRFTVGAGSGGRSSGIRVVRSSAPRKAPKKGFFAGLFS